MAHRKVRFQDADALLYRLERAREEAPALIEGCTGLPVLGVLRPQLLRCLEQPERHFDGLDEDEFPGVLHHVTVTRDIRHLIHERLLGVTGEKDDGHITSAEDLPCGFGPVHPGAEVDIHEDELDAMIRDDCGDRPFSGMDDPHVVAM